MSNDALVFIVDDEPSSRQAIESLVRGRGLHAEALSSTAELLSRYRGEPGCVVTDLAATVSEGDDVQVELKRRGWSIPVIALTAGAPTAAVVRAMRNGAVTVLDKPCSENDLWQAIAEALALDLERRRHREEMAGIRARFASLSDKERDVLRMIVSGRPNKAMANALGASLRTIENRRREVFSKLGVRSVAELVTLTLKFEGREDL